MADDWEALLIGLLFTAALRLLDFFAPKGHHSKWLDRYAVKDEKPEGDDESA